MLAGFPLASAPIAAISGGRREITAEGALVARRATFNGVSTKIRVVTAEGAFVAAPAILLGLGIQNRSFTGDGALVAPAATLSGLAAEIRTITGTGALVATAAALDGQGGVFVVITGSGLLQAGPAILNGVGIRRKTVTGSGTLVSYAPTFVGRQYAKEYIYTTQPPISLFLVDRASSDEPNNLGWIQVVQCPQFQVQDAQTQAFTIRPTKIILTSVVATSVTGVAAQIAVSIFNMDQTSRFDMFEQFDVNAAGLTKLPITRSIMDGQDILVFQSVDGAEVHLTASYVLVTEDEPE